MVGSLFVVVVAAAVVSAARAERVVGREGVDGRASPTGTLLAEDKGTGGDAAQAGTPEFKVGELDKRKKSQVK